MLEQARAENSRPEVLASWLASLDLSMRDLAITQKRLILNMDETHVAARELLTGDRAMGIGPVGMSKPKLVTPSIGAAASGCTLAATMSLGGVLAPMIVVVEGPTDEHAYVTVTKEGRTRHVPLASRLNENAMVVRHKPAGFDRPMFAKLAAHLSEFMKGVFPEEPKLLALDGAKVHFSVDGLMTLLRAGVTAIAEPSKLSHVIQALETRSLFGRFQPAVCRAIRVRADVFLTAKVRFSVVDLMDCINQAADESFTPASMASAFELVGMWLLSSSKVCLETLNNGVAKPSESFNLPFLKASLVPVVRKQMSVPVETNGTLSTAGRTVVLTAPKVLEALKKLDAERAERIDAQEKAQKVREELAAENRSKQTQRDIAAQERKHRRAWRIRCAEVVGVAVQRFCLLHPSPRKQCNVMVLRFP